MLNLPQPHLKVIDTLWYVIFENFCVKSKLHQRHLCHCVTGLFGVSFQNDATLMMIKYRFWDWLACKGLVGSLGLIRFCNRLLALSSFQQLKCPGRRRSDKVWWMYDFKPIHVIQKIFVCQKSKYLPYTKSYHLHHRRAVGSLSSASVK